MVPENPVPDPLPCKSSATLPLPAPLQNKRGAERSPGLRSWADQPPRLLPRFFSAQAPGDPKLSRNTDPTLREGTIPSGGCSTNTIGCGLREGAGTVCPSLPPVSAHTGTRASPAAARRDTPKKRPGVGALYGFVLFYRTVKQASAYRQYFGKGVCSR